MATETENGFNTQDVISSDGSLFCLSISNLTFTEQDLFMGCVSRCPPPTPRASLSLKGKAETEAISKGMGLMLKQ